MAARARDRRCCSASARRSRSLEDIAKQGAAALELANDYTDFIEAARRRKPTTPAAEIQQNLFPPRIARIAGAQLAGALLPTYEVGGDWFDFVENRDGAWLAIAERRRHRAHRRRARRRGARRAARRPPQRRRPRRARFMRWTRPSAHSAIPTSTSRAIVARWHAATNTFTWANCGHPDAMVVDTDGNVSTLDGPVHPSLGTPRDQPTFQLTKRQMAAGERLILVTDGITERKTDMGGRFGLDGIRGAIESLEGPTAAATAMAILHAVSHCCRDPLEDDGTVVVLGVA